MSHTINHLLIDQSAAPATTQRNFARNAEAMANAGVPGFADYLAAAKTQNNQQTASTNAAPVADASASGSGAVKPSSSSRVDTGASEVPASDENFAFSDVLDIINPLQHIPLVNTVYRNLTGDTIKPLAQVAGDMLYGGLAGSPIISGVVSIASTTMEGQNGDDPLTRVATALFGGDDDDGDSPKAVASATPETPAAPAPTAAIAATDVQATAPLPAPSPAPATAVVSTQLAPYGGVMNPTALAQLHHNMTPTATAANAPAATAANVNAKLPIPGAAAPSDSKTLGQLMHSQAQLSGGGNQLPPGLVNDMMLMALDKYKSAAGLAPSEIDVSAQN